MDLRLSTANHHFGLYMISSSSTSKAGLQRHLKSLPIPCKSKGKLIETDPVQSEDFAEKNCSYLIRDCGLVTCLSEKRSSV